MEDIRVCEIIDTYYPTVDGAINVVKHYSEQVSKRAHCILAVPKASKKSKYLDKENFEVIRCKSLPAPEGYRNASPSWDCKLKKRIKAEGIDIIHTHSPFNLGRFAIKTGKKLSVPVVATLHTQYHQDFERTTHNCKPIVKFLIRYILKVFNKADSVWTVSEKSCQTLRDYGYKGNIEVVRNGTDMVYPANAQELINRVNERHALTGQKNVFMFVGRMAWYKNLKIILDAVKIIKDSGLDFKMMFVGGGFDLDEVKAYAKKLDITDKCIFTGNVNGREELQAYYLRGDLLLFPSTFDMAPVTVVEASVHNLAAVMVKGSCSAEQVEDNVNGFLAEENAESFASRVLEVVKTPELIKTAGINAQKTLYRSWDMVGEEVVEKYKKIIKEYKEKKLNK